MTRYYIVKYSVKGTSKAVAMTYDKDEAIAICEHPKTATSTWFYGVDRHRATWSESQHAPARF